MTVFHAENVYCKQRFKMRKPMMKKSRCNCCKFLPYPFTPGKLLLGIGREVASVHWYSLEPF